MQPSSLRHLQHESGNPSTSIVSARWELTSSVAELTSLSSSVIVTDVGSNIASTASRRSNCSTSTTNRNLCIHNVPVAWKDIEEKLPLKGATDKIYADTADSFGECSTPEETWTSNAPFGVHWNGCSYSRHHVPLVLLQVVHWLLWLKKLEDSVKEICSIIFWGGIIGAYLQTFSTCLCCALFPLLAFLRINTEEYQMKNVKRHFRKRFGDASTKQVLALCGSCNYMNLPAAERTVAEGKDSMHTWRDEPDCQLDEYPVQREMPLNWGWLNWFEILTMFLALCITKFWIWKLLCILLLFSSFRV